MVPSRRWNMASDPSALKVMLWSTPRSLSSVFLRAMMNLPDCQTILEPLTQAYYFGEERTSKRYRQEPKTGCKYSEIKSQLEQPTHGKSITFVKDLAYCVITGDDFEHRIPEGYLHTFILRHPRKTVLSLYKASTSKLLTEWDYFDEAECGFQELYTMFNYVTQVLGQKPILVDADDLATNPEGVMKQYCAAVGLPFSDTLINWRPETLDMEVLGDWPLGWFGKLLMSTTFQPSAAEDPPQITLDVLPFNVQNAIQRAMPYYEKLRKFKLNP